MSLEDPRDDVVNQTVLTESSGDELADLAKEYEAKARRIMERKRLAKENKKLNEEKLQAQVTRSRSPSPIRKRTLPSGTLNAGVTKSQEDITEQRIQQQVEIIQRKREMMKTTHKSAFAKTFQTTSKLPKTQDLVTDKVFSFKDIPKPIDLTVDEKDPYTQLNLRKRYYTSEQLQTLLGHVKILVIEKFFAKVHAPLFHEPEYPNWAISGIVLSKSETKYTSDKKQKYMKLSVGDFHLSVDIMLFGDAYLKYWKVRVGDVVCILNPTIKPFRLALTTNGSSSSQQQQNSSPRGFNLVLDDDSECILEIGAARDLGYCKSIKRDGHRCSTPVNMTKSDYCNFHQELAIRKSGNKRMELNGSVTLKSPTRRDGSKQAMYVGRTGNNLSKSSTHITTDYTNYKPQTSNLYYANDTGKAFFRDEYSNPKILENLSEKRRKLKDAKEDANLQRKLESIKSQSSLKTLGLSKGMTSPVAKSDKVAFNPNLLNKIGFNPAATSTVGMNAHDGVYKSPTRRRKMLSENLQELFELSNSNASKKLTASMEDKIDKQTQWKKTMDNLERYRNTKEGTKKPSGALLAAPNISDPFLDSGSDSDIEIEFGNDLEKEKYTKMARGGNNITGKK
ncbi:minichromosome maintenance protein 10 [[Candida] anglica]|uniref:Minichromosome maintenance protein 10 n=1 Tax=[Candida] anglica TaxID=148631 RepID=A0ABP0E9G3_9ASCO